MKPTFRHRPGLRPMLAAALLTLLGGCATGGVPVIQRGADPLAQAGQATSVAADSAAPADAGKSDAPARITPGSGALINPQTADAAQPELPIGGEISLNFEGESLHAVVKSVLGDWLQQNYVIAPNVQGTVTLATPRPVDPAQALSLLEMVLGWNNARLVWADGRYTVVPADQAVAGNLAPRTGGVDNARGFEVRAVPLKFISAIEMEKLLKPYARANAVVSVDSARNLIVLGGSRAELQNYLRTVEVFDVDWLAGMSVGVFTLQSAEAAKVVTELDKLFGEAGKTPLAGMFRFMPLEGQNAVLVITPQAKYLKDIEDWIGKIDAGGEGARLYTYDVNYMKATDLADQLNAVFGGATSAQNDAAAPPSLMPGLEPVQIRSISTPAADAADPKARAQAGANANAGSGSGGAAGGGAGVALGNSSDVSISAVEESNALLVRASPSQWESIRRAIERLDTMPLQVHIEAQVVEVQLNGSLKYGVNWFFENQVEGADLPSATGRTTWGDIGGRVTDAGLGWTFLGRDAAAVVSALDKASDVRLLSTPSLVVRNNVEANLNVGTQIPVNSTSFNPIVGDQTNPNTGSYTQVQYLNTGVIMTVTPRISADGTVFLKIKQVVSSPGDTSDINGNVPVNQRELTTEAVVKSGETVMLAGLISETDSHGNSGLPVLSRLPVVGGLFGTRNDIRNRQEVVVLITPTVIRDPAAARKLTDEYGARFRALEPLRKDAPPAK